MKTIVWFGIVLGALSATGKVFITKTGTTTILECGVNSFSRSLTWNKNNDRIYTIHVRNGFEGMPMKGRIPIVTRSKVKEKNLEISKVIVEDAGKFTCEADGQTHHHTLLVVSVSASPSGSLQVGSEATLQCQVKGLDSQPEVQWRRPDKSAHSGSLKPVASSDAGTWQCTISHDGTIHTEDLEIKVTEPTTTKPAPVPSQNSKDGRKTCPGCATHPKSRSDAPLILGLNWWMWLIIGVGCLVVILLIVFVICLCKRIKRKKRKLQMKNSRQLKTPKQYCQCNRPAAVAKPRQGRRRDKSSDLPLQPLLIE
ncbi:CD4-2 molecule, tandem duplicate 2 [Dicentrarchus labrax]|uniref:CD4-2 molecule, tandem duplicate 2 n=1 Tax=Dicentrarchus labrax TaxID=13489 RepID=UPI001634B4FD|nr:CD4-2 molecule, tandem duplicate 2 [Dicentrarchus labrax]